jgi:membrane protease YdiL (CAAX protease family)
MSTDHPPPEPNDAAISRVPDLPPDRIGEPDPFVAELANGGMLGAELNEPYEEARPRPLPCARRPGPPHPGFWWAVLWCLLLLVVAEFAIPLLVALFIFAVQAVQLGGIGPATDWLEENEYKPAFLLPIQMSGHIAIFILALIALRLAAGKSWPRQVAIRLPAVTHVLLAVAGAPAFWLLGNGLQLIASRVLPPTGDLPSYVAVAALLMAIVGACWLLVRLLTGRDWVRGLAAAPLRVQIILGPLGVLVLLVLGAQMYQFVSPHVFRIPLLDGDLLGKGIEALLSIPWWASVLVIAVTPAFSEEFWCRAFLGRGLVGRQGFVMGIVWTSLFFGAIHVFPHQAAMAAILGLVLHSAYVASRSLLIPMLMHFLNNLLAVLSYKFLADASPRLAVVETEPQQIPLTWFAAAGLLAAAVLWAFYSSRGRLVRTDGSGEPPWQPPFAGVAHPPPGSGTEVVYSWPGLLPTLAVIAGVVALGGAIVS